MVTRCTSWAYVAAVLLLTVVSTATAKYSGGTGEPNDPYQIATAVDLIALGETPADYDKHFILTADIDLDPNLPGRKVFDKAVIAPSWETPFTGVFDGSGHTISHLTVQGGGYLGLFGKLSGAEIRDVRMVGVNVNGSGWYVGGLVGANGTEHGPGVVTGCYSTGTVSGTVAVGGLVGDDWFGYVTDCYTTGKVNGESGVGGLVGSATGDITRCRSYAVVRGTDNVGGLVGAITGWTITQCSSDGVVKGTTNVGGLAGLMEGSTIMACYSVASVSGRDQVGGLVGQGSPSYQGSGYGIWQPYLEYSISQCYSAGAVTGANGVGGLVGAVEADGVFERGEVPACLWDIQASGQTASAGGTGKTTIEMQTAKTFLDAGWDFVGETANGTEDIWKIAEGTGYPRLAWEKYSGGTGESNNPYQVATAADLIALGSEPNDYDKHFILTADIDLEPTLPGRKVFDKAVIAPAVNAINGYFDGTPFTGVFDGNGRTISHPTITGTLYLGLFGQLGSGAEVKKLGVANVNITGSECVGGLAAYNYGDVDQCYSDGAVSGDGCGVGGLMGINSGTVTQCYSTVAVSGGWDVGGLVGLNGERGRIVDCYSTGSVNTDSDIVGGLVGYSVYLIGSEATGCFWDIQTSGQTTSDGGSGKPTAEMKMQSTFTEAGWDFVGETANGTEDIWKIAEGLDYPRLWWETTEE